LAAPVFEVVRLDAELRHHRAGVDLHDAARRAEATQRVLDDARLLQQHLVRDAALGPFVKNLFVIRQLPLGVRVDDEARRAVERVGGRFWRRPWSWLTRRRGL